MQSGNNPVLSRSGFAVLCFGLFMSNELTVVNRQRCLQPTEASSMTVHQGNCIQLDDSQQLFQVIGIDDSHDRCWVRRWPLQTSGGSDVFEVSLGQIQQTDTSDHHKDRQAAIRRP